jgi:hypothetical protein
MSLKIDEERKRLTLDEAMEAHESTRTLRAATLLIAVALDYHRDEMLGEDGFHEQVSDALITLLDAERIKE